MKGKISAFEIALSAVACAFSTIFLSLGLQIDVLLATGYVVGCFALMLPLSKGFIWGDVLAYIATVLLTFLLGGVSMPWRILPFVLFFGLHPLVNHLQVRFKWNKIVSLVIKTVWFDVTAYILWRFVFDMTAAIPVLDQYIIPVILIGGSLFFIVYDRMIFKCQQVVNRIVYRIRKK